MTRGWGVSLAILGATVLLSAPRALTPARAADPPAAAPEKKPKTYTVKSGPLHYDASKKLYHFTSSSETEVVFTQDKVTMSMDQCDYDDDHQTAVGSGHLKIVDPESTITGDLLKVNFDTKFAQIIGNVTIVTQKKKPEGTAEQPAEGEKKPTTVSEYREKKTTITCPQIDYYYADDKKQATVTGPVKAVQEDKTVTSDKAYYDGVKDEVKLDGNVIVTMEKGNEFHCPEATIHLKDDSFEAPNITGVVIQEEEKPKEAPPPAAPNGEAKPPPAPGANG